MECNNKTNTFRKYQKRFLQYLYKKINKNEKDMQQKFTPQQKVDMLQEELMDIEKLQKYPEWNTWKNYIVRRYLHAWSLSPLYDLSQGGEVISYSRNQGKIEAYEEILTIEDKLYTRLSKLEDMYGKSHGNTGAVESEI